MFIFTRTVPYFWRDRFSNQTKLTKFWQIASKRIAHFTKNFLLVDTAIAPDAWETAL